MSLFSSESEMHKWLREALNDCHGLADIIRNTEYLKEFVPNRLEESRVLDSFNTCMSALYSNEIISDDKNISLDRPDSLKPDLLMYAAEPQGIVIVELKNLADPTRQAGTELSAYAGEVRTYIPFLSEADLFNVVISTSWPTLLRHYIFHEIFWQQKNIICLEPVMLDGEIQLEIKKIPELLEADTATRISERHLSGYHLCLYDNDLYKQNPDRERLNKHIPQMKAALSVMAAEGNAHKGHGFAFLWKDHWELSLAPYNITMLNFAPFQSIERFLHNIDSLDDLSDMQKRFIQLIQDEDPTGHSNSLYKIRSSGCRFLKSVCNPIVEGFHNWDTLRDSMQDQGELLAFQGWGMFGKIFNERLISEYSSGNVNLSLTCPTLGLKVVADLIDPNYKFIHLPYIEL